MSVRHRFTVDGKKYVYDAVSSHILAVGEGLYDLLPRLHHLDTTVDSLGKLLDEHPHGGSVKDLFATDLLSLQKARLVNPVNLPQFAKSFINNSSALTLCITDQCSLRCSYCPYTHNTGSRRMHGARSMSRGTALQAVEFLRQRLDPEEPPLISFYGGEPLLELELVKEVMAHARRQLAPTAVNFALNTNGLLMSNGIIDFLVANNVTLYVSLDGPAYIHDRYRADANGRGSFAKVMESLNALQRQAADYFRRKVRINMVLAPPLELDAVNDFLLREMPVPIANCSISLVDAADTLFFRDHPYTDKDAKSLRRLRRQVEQAFITGTLGDNPLASLVFKKGILRVAQRNRRNTAGAAFLPTGQCFPAAFKLFVDTDGNVHICERIEELVPIGDIWQGLCQDAISSLLTPYYEDALKTCDNCFAQRICGICVEQTTAGGAFNLRRKREACAEMRYRLHRNLCSYIRILQQNPDAFKGYTPQPPLKPFGEILHPNGT